jgi:hypothetical protein
MPQLPRRNEQKITDGSKRLSRFSCHKPLAQLAATSEVGVFGEDVNLLLTVVKYLDAVIASVENRGSSAPLNKTSRRTSYKNFATIQLIK